MAGTSLPQCSSLSVFERVSSDVPMGSASRGGNVVVYVFEINQQSLPSLFFFLSVLGSVFVFMALSTVFHCINSPNYSLLFHSVLPVLFLALFVLLTIYLFMKVSLSPHIILCGWLGFKHQITKSHLTWTCEQCKWSYVVLIEAVFKGLRRWMYGLLCCRVVPTFGETGLEVNIIFHGALNLFSLTVGEAEWSSHRGDRQPDVVPARCVCFEACARQVHCGITATQLTQRQDGRYSRSFYWNWFNT